MLKERIRFLLHQKKCPLSRLVDTETMRARIGRQINGEASIPFSTIYLILYTFPDVSADWLVRGEGPMERASEKVQHHHHNSYTNTHSVVNIESEVHIDSKIEELQKQLEAVTKDRDFLKSMLEAMTKH